MFTGIRSLSTSLKRWRRTNRCERVSADARSGAPSLLLHRIERRLVRPQAEGVPGASRRRPGLDAYLERGLDTQESVSQS